MSELRTLNFILSDNIVPFSLSPLDSDYWGNLVIMEQVVGTLIKYTSEGSDEPYLLDRWESSKNELIWKFHFRSGLKDERGEPIDAIGFERSLKKLLKIYAESYDPPAFNMLQGWHQFKKTGDGLGVTAVSPLLLEMRFDKRPSGLLDFLAMPYFGYYSDADFDADGKWKNPYKITSTGAFSVVDARKDFVRLKARDSWHSFKGNHPTLVEFSSGNLQEALKFGSQPTLISLKKTDKSEYKGFKKFYNPPTFLTALVLSPYLYPFDDKDVRNSFRSVARSLLKEISLDSAANHKTDTFYRNPGDLSVRDIEIGVAVNKLRSLGKLKIKSFRQSLTNNSDVGLIEELLSRFSKLTGWEFEIQTPEDLGPSWQKKAFSNKDYALRVARVDIGGSPENWVVEMMFCSNLGVSFPDKEQGVCKLVSDYSLNKIESRTEYGKRLHQSIESESSVVPLLHSGMGWLISDKVQTEQLSPTMVLPRLDQLEILE